MNFWKNCMFFPQNLVYKIGIQANRGSFVFYHFDWACGRRTINHCSLFRMILCCKFFITYFESTPNPANLSVIFTQSGFTNLWILECDWKWRCVCKRSFFSGHLSDDRSPPLACFMAAWLRYEKEKGTRAIYFHVSWQQLTLYLISLGNLRQEGTFHRELQMSHFPFSTATLQLFIAILFVDQLFNPSAFGNSWTISEPGGFVIVTKHLVFLLCLGK